MVPFAFVVGGVQRVPSYSPVLAFAAIAHQQPPADRLFLSFSFLYVDLVLGCRYFATEVTGSWAISKGQNPPKATHTGSLALAAWAFSFFCLGR